MVDLVLNLFCGSILVIIAMTVIGYAILLVEKVLDFLNGTQDYLE